MKQRKPRLWAVIVSSTLPGFFAWSCSSSVGRQFRDASVAGAVEAVQGRVFEWVTDLLALPEQSGDSEE